MDFVSDIEDLIIEFNELVVSFQFLSEIFENKVQDDFSYLIKYDKELYNNLQSFYVLFRVMYKSFDEIYSKFQKEINLYYETMN